MEEYYKIFDEGQYVETFQKVKQYLDSEEITSEKKSEAYNLLGLCVSLDSDLAYDDIESESGILFFEKAVEYDSNNISAWLNIISSYGHIIGPQHQRKKLFLKAIDKLDELNYQLSEKTKLIIEKKLKS